jgi:hypothetical protein
MIKGMEIPPGPASGNKEKSAEKACKADTVRTGWAGSGEGRGCRRRKKNADGY